jgi:growth hormone-inducible transmembrane protein
MHSILPFTLISTQKILHHARLAEHGMMKVDPLKESIGLELDMINILYVHCHKWAALIHGSDVTYAFSIRLVQILAMQGNRKK